MSISWTNLYPGVDHATGTNPTDSPTPNNVNILRVDLTNPQIALTSTPKKLLSPEGVKTTEFLSEMFRSDMLAMFAINANFFDMDHRDVAFGLSVCEGCRVTPYADQQRFELAVSKGNVAQVTTAKEISPFPWTAVAGTPQLINNAELAISDLPSPLVAARTAVGLSSSSAGSPPQYLYLLTIDGLENSNSPYYGATFQDLAGWLLLAGAYNGFALDGGGSTTMAQISAPGQPSLMNVPHDDEHSGNEAERAVTISLGVVVLRDG